MKTVANTCMGCDASTQSKLLKNDFFKLNRLIIKSNIKSIAEVFHTINLILNWIINHTTRFQKSFKMQLEFAKILIWKLIQKPF